MLDYSNVADGEPALSTDQASEPAPGSMAGVRCLVLGAGGFLGRALTTALQAEGAFVHAYGRSMPPAATRAARITWTESPLEDTTALAKALRGQEVVFHLVSASLPDTSNRDPATDVLSQVLPSIRLLDLCCTAQVRKVVYASSGGTVYGIPAIVPTPETSDTVPISAYGINKLMIERYLELYRHLHGLDYHVLRIANPYGPGQSPFRKQGVVAAMLHRALSGLTIELWGTGDVTRDFVHVGDVADAFIAAARYAGPHRTMNVGSGHGRSLNQIIGDVRDILDMPALSVVRTPARAADVPISVLDTTLIQRHTGWRATMDWTVGLASTAGWMRGAYGL